MEALDPDFLDELTVRLVAEVDAERAKRKRKERHDRAARARREMARQMGSGWVVEEAEVE